MRLFWIILFMFCMIIEASDNQSGSRHRSTKSSSLELLLDEVTTAMDELWFEGYDKHDEISAQAYQDFFISAYDGTVHYSQSSEVRKRLTEKNLANADGNIFEDKLNAYRSLKIKGKQ